MRQAHAEIEQQALALLSLHVVSGADFLTNGPVTYKIVEGEARREERGLPSFNSVAGAFCPWSGVARSLEGVNESAQMNYFSDPVMRLKTSQSFLAWPQATF